MNDQKIIGNDQKRMDGPDFLNKIVNNFILEINEVSPI